jgi:predicted dehydrogenase
MGIPRSYGSYEALLADSDVQAVINALPNSMHCEWTVKAAEAGKHVLCEKPLAMTIEEAQRMSDAARADRILIMEGFTTRFLPQFAFARELITSGVIGPVRIVRAELTYTIRDWVNDSRTRAELGGGALFDAGCYCVNTIRAMMGDEPLSVQAFERIKTGHDIDASFVGILRFRDDRLAYLATGMEEPFRTCCEIIGTTGRIEIPGLFDGRRVKAILPDGELIREFAEIDRFTAQIEHFSDCILTGQPPLLPIEDALANTAVLVALRQAARGGKAVELV